jgi:hypothetical protein
MDPEKNLTEKESLALITTMINKAKEVYHETGISSIMWGAVIAVCSIVKFAEVRYGFHLPFDIYLLTLVAVIPQIFLTMREKKMRRVKSYDDVYMDYIWLSFGISIGLLIFIVNNIAAGLEPVTRQYAELARTRTDWTDFRFSEYISPLFLMLYGLPTFITGAACKFRPMLWGGLLCWVCCIITIYTSLETDLLLTACSAVFAWLIPGIIMEKDYKNAKQGLAQSNV